MGSSWLAGGLALVAGVAGALQVAVMGRFGERIGSLEALAFSAVITAAIAALGLLVVRQSLAGYASAWSSPRWMWLGGLFGVVIVLAITIAAPRVGVLATTSLLIFGQLATATLADRNGWFGVDRIGVSAPKLAGLGLLVLGTILTLRR